jgi:hypothetical protein
MIESSLTRGSERTRSRSETVTNTEPCVGATGEADWLADAIGVATPVEGNGVGVDDGGGEPQPASIITSRIAKTRCRFEVRIPVSPARMDQRPVAEVPV